MSFKLLTPKFTTAAFLLILALLFSFGELYAQTSSETERPAGATAPFDARERIEIFEQVWNLINEKYYDPYFNGIDWATVQARYRPLIAAPETSERDFYILLDRMAGELRDSHTRVFSPRQRAERRSRQATSAGLTIREIEGLPVVVRVSPDSDASRLGVKAGMIVREINDQPIEKALAAARQSIGTSSSVRSTEMRAFSKLLAGNPGTTLKLKLNGSGVRDLEVVLERRTVLSAPLLDARLLSSGNAYIKFNQFSPPLAGQIEEALRKFKDAPGLVLDLRGNGGGDGETGLKIAGYFFNEAISVARLVTRTGKPPFPDMPMNLQIGAPGAGIYSRPLVVLIDEATASTAELISAALQETKRARVIGTVSCGCVLAFLGYQPLKGGGDLSLSEFGFITPKGRRLEGTGIIPDTIIKPAVKDIRIGRDRALEQADRYLRNLSRDRP